MKVYTTFSGRRASTDIRGCEERGHIGKAMHYNTHLPHDGGSRRRRRSSCGLIEESAAPLAEIENVAGQFAQDCTGFSTVTYDRWFDQKHGKLRAEHPWVKLHVMIGTVTNVVTGVKVSNEADCPLLPELLAQTAKRFQVNEVSARQGVPVEEEPRGDRVRRRGAVHPVQDQQPSACASKSEHWKRMWAHFTLKSQDFLEHYHRRSNVESAMWMIKSKFGGAVRSKLPDGADERGARQGRSATT